jgi:hypothetical protein
MAPKPPAPIFSHPTAALQPELRFVSGQIAAPHIKFRCVAQN